MTDARELVKPLEWHPSRDGRGQIAVCPAGQYAVFDEGDPRWAFSKRGGYAYHKAESVEAAIAAAQADWNARARTIINPAFLERVERLEAAARTILDRGYVSSAIAEEKPDHDALRDALAALSGEQSNAD